VSNRPDFGQALIRRCDFRDADVEHADLTDATYDGATARAGGVYGWGVLLVVAFVYLVYWWRRPVTGQDSLQRHDGDGIGHSGA
jgi:hypothetical protein